ncbi:P-type ATPase [Artemisia annua]|uniref:P-type ATPase n=1 Tax=Artemisia annua TaxID=35608 RepID=A0A2U1P039_ARTAN|nr:P-type ATPase [Artemisia annua]
MTKSGANDPGSPSSGTHSPPPLIDIESGPPIDVDEDDFDDPFAITTTKNASTETLKRWRQAALVLNASRRFRYTLDLRKNEDQEKRKRMIRLHCYSNWLGNVKSGLEEGWIDGGSITFAVLLVIFVTGEALDVFHRYDIQSLQFQNLNAEKRNIQIEITRGGRREKVSIYDVVVGDVIPLNIGDQVPADGLLIKGHSLSIDESSMTGESKIVHKDPKAPFLMSGCKVADGAGTMLVTSVGINTEWGLLMASICEDTGEETPLQVRLNGIATFIGIVGVSVASLVLTVLLARFFTGNSKDPDGTVQFVGGKTSVSEATNDVIKYFTAAVTIIVVAVPEGLPLAVTLTLAYSMKKMMVDKALVRRLSACETMGSATTICSDKTGTLTLNQMTVVEACVGQTKIDPPEDGLQYHTSVSSLLHEGIAQNTSGSVFFSKPFCDRFGVHVFLFLIRPSFQPKQVNGHRKSSAVGKGASTQVQSSFNLQVISNGRIGPKKVSNAFAPRYAIIYSMNNKMMVRHQFDIQKTGSSPPETTGTLLLVIGPPESSRQHVRAPKNQFASAFNIGCLKIGMTAAKDVKSETQDAQNARVRYCRLQMERIKHRDHVHKFSFRGVVAGVFRFWVAVRVYRKGSKCKVEAFFPENIVSYGCIEGRHSVRTSEIKT